MHHVPICAAPRLKMSPRSLSEEQKLSFVRDGFVIISGFISSETLEAATSFIDDAYNNGEYQENTRKILGESLTVPDFATDVKNAPEVLDLIFKTGLQDIAEDLLGDDLATVTDNEGHVMFTPPCQSFIEQGMDTEERYPKRRWKIDGGEGKYSKKGSAFSLLVSVALSEDQDIDENRGQVMIWPGTFALLWLERGADFVSYRD